MHRTRKRKIRKIYSLWGYCAALLLILLGWEATALVLRSPAVPGPYTTFTVFFLQFPALLPQFAVSFYRVLCALCLGTAAAFPVAVTLARSEKADRVFAPFLFLTYPVPKVVLLPVFLVLLGLGDAAKIALISVTVFFQVMMAMRDAVRRVPHSYIDSVRSMGARRADIYRHVIVPAVLPDLYAALRIAGGTGVALLFIAESVAGTSGLGYMIMNAWSLVDYPNMFAAITAMAVLGLAVYEIISLLEYKTCSWTRAGK